MFYIIKSFKNKCLYKLNKKLENCDIGFICIILLEGLNF